MKTVIVTGGRDFEDSALVYKALDEIKPDLIVEGGCRTGADMWARCYASHRGVESVTVSADWYTFGRKAGPIRNLEMCENYPEAIVVAFPGGKGTNGCVDIALKAGMTLADYRGFQ